MFCDPAWQQNDQYGDAGVNNNKDIPPTFRTRSNTISLGMLRSPMEIFQNSITISTTTQPVIE